MRPFPATRRHCTALRAIGTIARGVPVRLDTEQADDCCRQGWAIHAPGKQQYRLTEAGREVLMQQGYGGRDDH